MATIALTQGLVAVVDDADFEWLSPAKWRAQKAGSNGLFYAVRRGSAGSSLIHMHRELCCPPAGLYIDHINGDGLDNRRINLRLCTREENARNCPGRTEGFKGVKFIRGAISRPYVALIRAGGPQQYIGSFESAEAAARAYDTEARRQHGEFAWLNFPDEPRPPRRCHAAIPSRSDGLRWNTKVGAADREVVLRELNAGQTHKALALRFGVHRTRIGQIAREAKAAGAA